MKKAYKWILGVIATPFVLVAIIAVLLYIPPIQNWAVKQVAAYASDETNMEITVEHVRLVFPLDLGVDGLRVLQQNDSLPQLKDTIADARNLTVDVRLLPLFSSQVEIDKLDFSSVKLNTANFVASARVKGYVGRVQMQSHGIDLGKETLRLDDAVIADAQLDIALSDTVPEDTSTSETKWKINVDRLKLQRSALTLHMPGDTLQVGAYIGQVQVDGGHFDLQKGLYQIAKLDLADSRLNYDNIFETYAKGLDYNHMALSDIAIGIDSLSYCDSRLTMKLRSCSFKEKSGLCVTAMSGAVDMDSTKITLPQMQLRTPDSNIQASVDMDFNAFDNQHPGNMSLTLDASIGKQDIVRFVPDMPAAFVRNWPNYPLTAKGIVRGNARHIDLSGVVLSLPTAFNARFNGYVANVMDTNHLGADINLKANTYNLGFLTALMGTSQVRIPYGIGIAGRVKASGSKYSLNMTASQGGGTVKAVADANLKTMAYKAHLTASSLPLQNFVPGMGLSPFSGNVDIVGAGTDMLSPRTTLSAKADISSFHYSTYDLSGMNLVADVKNGRGHATLDSHNGLLDGTIVLDALMSTSKVQAAVSCNLAKADLYRMKVVDNPLTTSILTDLDIESDLKSSHKISGAIKDIYITDSARTYHPENIVVDAFTRKDSTHTTLSSGDFALKLDAKGGYEQIINNGQGLMAEMQKQWHDRYIDQVRIRQYLPQLNVHFAAGKENFFGRALRRYGYHYRYAHIDLTSSETTGINGHVDIDSLVAAGVQLDTIRLKINSDSIRTDFEGQVRNAPGNPQYVFNALFRGAFYERGLYFGTRIYDADDRVGISVGMNAAMEDNGIRLRLGGRDTPILGYKPFEVNKDNYLFLADDQRVSANLKLQSDDGMGVTVYSNDSTEALQDITLGLTNFELSKVLSVVPYVPDVSGVMNGDFHVIQTTEELSVASFVTVDSLVYEKCPMGDIASEFVYIPKGDGSHFVDGSLSCNDKEVGNLRGTYKPEGEGYLDAKLDLAETPLDLVNGFIPDKLFSLRGRALGTLSVKGTMSALNVDGEVKFDSAYIASEPYGVELRFDTTPVTISKSHMVFDNFSMFAHNNSPLTISGYYDFSDFNNMYLDLGVRAMNYLLIDSKENLRSEAYGKAYVNFFAKLNGSLESMRVRGKLDVLGSTDMTYILRDSPLTTDNQVEDLVKFVNFNDTTQDYTVTRPPLTGIDMDLSMSIDEGAHIVCALNADHSNYVDLIGGGDLRMQYNVVDDLRLTGKYTLSNGEMKYSLPVIPLKTFTIQDGSYIEFMGDPMNPKLNITATEQTKSSVSTDGGSARTVEFTCGVVITKTLQDMGLQFIIDAPEDMTIHNELQTMSEENRGKLAVTMLTTGMYLASGNTSAFSMNSALSAFLNSQISAISGNALRTLDLSFGMDNTTTGTGQTQTDYSFKFAKRFWNNRLSIVVGGKVSTGADVQNQNNTFFDNVTFEYRLSQNSNKYLKLFYERDSYDWLEGNVGKYGGGFMWKRKLQHFRDIFRFKSSKQQMPPAKQDTLKVNNDEAEKQ